MLTDRLFPTFARTAPIVIVWLLIAAPSHGADTLHYGLDIAPNGKMLTASICAETVSRRSFRLPPGAEWIDEKPAFGAADDDRSCISYRQTLNPSRQARYFETGFRTGITRTSLADILACKNGGSPPVTQLALQMAKQMRVSFPGEKIAAQRFELAKRPCQWSSSVLWGDIAQHEFALAGGTIRIAMPSALAVTTQEKLVRWIRAGFNALSLAYGRLPVGEVQVLLFPVGANNEAVPWGEVKRGGGDAVHLYVDETRSESDLNADWVLVHELSHLLHPYLIAADGWLSEGIASYYQNVLRARAGLLTGPRAWEKLDAGFQRGEKQFDPDMRLFENTRKMMRERQYMRVYWSGAAIAMIGDVELRRLSGGTQSLDTLLAEIARCCLPSETRRWDAQTLIKRFDDISQTNIFSRLYDHYVMQPKFPDLENTYKLLGLTRTGNRLDFAAAGAALRQQIITRQ